MIIKRCCWAPKSHSALLVDLKIQDVCDIVGCEPVYITFPSETILWSFIVDDKLCCVWKETGNSMFYAEGDPKTLAFLFRDSYITLK